MSYVIVQFSEPREVFIDDQSQGDNLAASGRPRALLTVRLRPHRLRVVTGSER